MAELTGRNQQQPDYLNEKDQAEDTQQGKAEKDTPEKNVEREREKERVNASLINQAFDH